MTEKKRFNFDFKVLIGLLVIAAGTLLLMQSFGVNLSFEVWDFWPVVLILVGLGKILQPREFRNPFWGFVILGVGILFLLNNLNIVDFWFDDLWPVLIIIAGFAIIKGSIFRQGHKQNCCPPSDSKFGSFEKKNLSPDMINISTAFGGGEYNFTSKNLKGGKINVAFGGCDLDLRDADIEGDQMVIETSVFCGGVEIWVPSKWEVVVQGSPFLGAIENKTRPLKTTEKKIIITGSAVMGAIEVKN